MSDSRARYSRDTGKDILGARQTKECELLCWQVKFGPFRSLDVRVSRRGRVVKASYEQVDLRPQG